MKKKIISFFKKNSNTSFKSKEIAKRLKLSSDEEIDSLKHFLYQLYDENFLTRNGKRYKLNQNASSGKITGQLQISPGGFGFVVPSDKNLSDIFIASRNLSTIVHEPPLAGALARSGDFDLVVYGHTHVPDVRVEGGCLIVNPGKTARLNKGRATVALLETETREALILDL